MRLDPAGQRVARSTLPGGLQAITVRMPGFRSAALWAVVRSGARHERPAETGMAHFLEHLAFKGTAGRDAAAIATEIEVMGSAVNAMTAREMTAYTIGGLRDAMPRAIGILGDVLTRSAYRDADIETERGVVIEEIRQSDDQPAHRASRGFMAAAFPDQALSRPILGTEASLSAFGRPGVVDFVRRHHHAGNMVVIGAGDLVHDEFRDRVADAFADLPAAGQTSEGLVPARYRGGQFVERNADTQQIMVGLGLPGPADTGPAVRPSEVLAQALGAGLASPLFQAVRQRLGLAYAINASSDTGSDYGLLRIHAGTSAANLGPLLAEICAQLRDAADTLTETDLERARNGYLAGLATVCESPFRTVRALTWSLLAYGEPLSPDEKYRQVEAVTLPMLRDAARAMLDGVPTLALVGPVGMEDPYGFVRERLGG